MRFGILGALLVAGALPVEPVSLPSISGAPPPPVETNFTVEGKITQLSPGKLTLSTEGNIIFHVRYDDKTDIQRADGNKGSDKDFRVGVKVKVDGDLTESGEVVTARIAIQ
jgi:hypothetical protein